MKKWQKTEIRWNNRYRWITNIPADDFSGARSPSYDDIRVPNPAGGDPLQFPPHSIRDVIAVSVPDMGTEPERRAVITFNIIRGTSDTWQGATTRKKEIYNKLTSLSNTNRNVHIFTAELGPGWKVQFNLSKPFCEDVLDFMAELFSVFGIVDTVGVRMSDFTVTTETMYAQGVGWISYADYLRQKRRLYVSDEGLNVVLMPRLDILKD